MSQKGFVAVAFAALFAPAVFSTEPVKVNYTCGGLKYDAEYSTDGKTVTFHKNKAYELTRQPAESGIHYSNARQVELRGKSRTEDVEIRPGGRRSFGKCQGVEVIE